MAKRDLSAYKAQHEAIREEFKKQASNWGRNEIDPDLQWIVDRLCGLTIEFRIQGGPAPSTPTQSYVRSRSISRHRAGYTVRCQSSGSASGWAVAASASASLRSRR